MYILKIVLIIRQNPSWFVKCMAVNVWYYIKQINLIFVTVICSVADNLMITSTWSRRNKYYSVLTQKCFKWMEYWYSCNIPLQKPQHLVKKNILNKIQGMTLAVLYKYINCTVDKRLALVTDNNKNIWILAISFCGECLKIYPFQGLI